MEADVGLKIDAHPIASTLPAAWTVLLLDSEVQVVILQTPATLQAAG